MVVSRNTKQDILARDLGYGVGIRVGTRVELSPHLDLWMQGAKYGDVLGVSNEVARVKLDRVRRVQRVHVNDLKKV